MRKFKIGDTVTCVDFSGRTGELLEVAIKGKENRFKIKSVLYQGRLYVLEGYENRDLHCCEERLEKIKVKKATPVNKTYAERYKAAGFKLVSFDKWNEADPKLRYVNAVQNIKLRYISKNDDCYGIIHVTSTVNNPNLHFLIKIEKKEPKKYYKVVRNLCSSDIIEPEKDSRKQVKYKINEWVSAPGNTRLFVSDSLEHAKSFSDCNTEIYECKIKGGVKIWGTMLIKQCDEYWEKVNRKIKNRHCQWKSSQDMQKSIGMDLFSFYAIGAKAVKLIKKVD